MLVISYQCYLILPYIISQINPAIPVVSCVVSDIDIDIDLPTLWHCSVLEAEFVYFLPNSRINHFSKES